MSTLKSVGTSVSYFSSVIFSLSFADVKYSAKLFFSEQLRPYKFANGMRSKLSIFVSLISNLTNQRHLVVVISGDSSGLQNNYAHYSRDLRKKFGKVETIRLSNTGKIVWTTLILPEGNPPVLKNFLAIRNYILQFFPEYDLLILENLKKFPSMDEVALLKFGAYKYGSFNLVGATCSSYRYQGEITAGFDYSRLENKWIPSKNNVFDWGQLEVPRNVLVRSGGALYIPNSSLISEHSYPGLAIHSVDDFLTSMQLSGKKLLCIPQIVVQRNKNFSPKPTSFQKKWITDRTVTNPEGKIRVIFVLPATSMSGGIRVVMEIADSLNKQVFDVEIWSLESNPTWFELSLSVRKFKSYKHLKDALSLEDALKVATWWETGSVVWDASINKGIPVNFVQEFETWFFPDDQRIQAAVVASYRQEFFYIATGGYQQNELKNQGIKASLIPVGFDSSTFKQLDVPRSSNTILAVGRSFFQKNFKMTLNAWRLIPENNRPTLQLFGQEPEIATDKGVNYQFKPTDSEVARLYSSSTIFVQTSLHEGFSLPILEAMACGCPVITTNSHGNMDFCVDKQNCLVVEQNNEEELKEAIQLLLRDSDLQDRLRKSAQKTAKKYEWKQITPLYENYFMSIANRISSRKSEDL